MCPRRRLRSNKPSELLSVVTYLRMMGLPVSIWVLWVSCLLSVRNSARKRSALSSQMSQYKGRVVAQVAPLLHDGVFWTGRTCIQRLDHL